MKIAILGTRGIPNNYGGFEQFAEYLSVGLVNRGHDVTVYNPHFHSYSKETFQGVKIRYIYSPENWLGAAANFIYDFLCLRDALKMDYDIILECGYHSNAPSYYLMGKRSRPVLVTNMDGLEWARSKWNLPTRALIKRLEKMAIQRSHYLVSDNKGIQNYYQSVFNAESAFIPYGAELVTKIDLQYLNNYSLSKNSYYLLIARLEPENNIEMILDGYIISESQNYPFIVIGNFNNKYGRYLIEKYTNTSVRFIGSIYDKSALDTLRYYARIYFHGHSVGGTNPSLLEAMASQAFIAAHDNEFNRSVCEDNAIYFSSPKEVMLLMRDYESGHENEILLFKKNNLNLIDSKYRWEYIIEQYESLFNACVKNLEK